METSQLENWFMHHPPTPEQSYAFDRLRSAALHFAMQINALVPDSADKTAAIRKVREATMTAIAAIACGGK